MDLHDRATYKFEGGLEALYTTSSLISPQSDWHWLCHNCILHIQNKKIIEHRGTKISNVLGCCLQYCANIYINK